MAEQGGRRRRTWWFVAIAVVVVAGGLAVRAWWPQDRATRVEADEALDRFHDTTTSTPTTVAVTTAAPTTSLPPRDLPEPGVYRYATTGTESVDILGGATHDYPPQTLLTVTLDGCGVRLRWDLLAERRDEWRLCVTADGVELQTTGSHYHEFYSNGRLEALVCSHKVLLVPTDDSLPPEQSVTCLLDGAPWNPTWTAVGHETLTVDGSSVETLHLRMVVNDGDAHFERTTMDWWLAPTGLPVRMTTQKESNTDSGVIGDVYYTETYTADLASFDPLT